MDIPDTDKLTSAPTIEYQYVSYAVKTPVSTQANFNPGPVPQPRDAAAVNKFEQEREFVVQYVRNAITAAVDRQKEYAQRRGRTNLEKFAVGDRVLLSTAAIQPAAVTNLGANKLAPRFIGHTMSVKTFRVGDV
ncbi:LOW QUALITY PROTEIN: hypothetical protein PHMEG_00018555 [Phytophthora megakarya]|uniref:Uncharacterized protein n=1 Tax=Phytophthora megakarya TaxID=4795 RepID=A0A225VTR7_9STRA|nr:LOW QUALITY PROTEIN: hypothetical protein PHMEG_00018555 [Phytophthora megakarya]